MNQTHLKDYSKNPFIQGFAFCATIIGILFGVLGLYEYDITKWIEMNIAWIAPFCFFLITMTAFWVGYFFANIPKYRMNTDFLDLNEELSSTSLDVIMEMERNATRIFVVSPRLYYDVVDIEFKELVKENRKKNKLYKYIVPDTKKIRVNIEKYKIENNLTQEIIESDFLVMDNNEIALSFLNEIVIYYEKETNIIVAFQYPPTTDKVHKGIFKLGHELSNDYLNSFIDIWIEKKDYHPFGSK